MQNFDGKKSKDRHDDNKEKGVFIISLQRLLGSDLMQAPACVSSRVCVCVCMCVYVCV